MPSFQDLTNQKFGRLKVVRRISNSKNNKIKWLCECECGNECDVLSTQLKYGGTRSCGCLRSELVSKKFRRGCGEIHGKSISDIRIRAKNKGIEFSLSPDFLWNLYLKQDGKCAITGLPLEHNTSIHKSNKKKGHPLRGTASLDRIDSSKGYIEENVQWVHKTVNMMKNTLSMDEFYSFCKAVVLYKETRQ